jgi:hypothetical protein
MANYRVLLSFTELADANLCLFTSGIVKGLTDNPVFPSPPVPVDELADAKEAFATAMSAAALGGKLLTLEKNERREELLALLRQEASYVQTVAGTDLIALLSSGFLAASNNRVPSPLPQARIKKLVNGQSGQLLLNVFALENAKSYEVQIKIGEDWISMGAFASPRIVLEGLTPLQLCLVRVRGIGGSTNYSEWSDPVSRVVV